MCCSNIHVQRDDFGVVYVDLTAETEVARLKRYRRT